MHWKGLDMDYQKGIYAFSGMSGAIRDIDLQILGKKSELQCSTVKFPLGSFDLLVCPIHDKNGGITQIQEKQTVVLL